MYKCVVPIITYYSSLDDSSKDIIVHIFKKDAGYLLTAAFECAIISMNYNMGGYMNVTVS